MADGDFNQQIADTARAQDAQRRGHAIDSFKDDVLRQLLQKTTFNESFGLHLLENGHARSHSYSIGINHHDKPVAGIKQLINVGAARAADGFNPNDPTNPANIAYAGFDDEEKRAANDVTNYVKKTMHENHGDFNTREQINNVIQDINASGVGHLESAARRAHRVEHFYNYGFVVEGGSWQEVVNTAAFNGSLIQPSQSGRTNSVPSPTQTGGGAAPNGGGAAASPAAGAPPASGAQADDKGSGRHHHVGGGRPGRAAAANALKGKAADAPNISDDGVGTLGYQYGKSELSAADKTALDKVAKAMEKDPTLQFDITGNHTGNDSLANLALAKARAQAAADYLIKEKHISADRLHVTAQVGAGGLTTEFKVHKGDAAAAAAAASTTPADAPPPPPASTGTVEPFHLDKRAEAYLHEHLEGVKRRHGFLGMHHDGTVALSVATGDVTDPRKLQSIRDAYTNALSQKEGFNPAGVTVILQGEPNYDAAHALPYQPPKPMALTERSETLLDQYLHTNNFSNEDQINVSVRLPTGLSRLQRQEALENTRQFIELDGYRNVQVDSFGEKKPPANSVTLDVTPGGAAPPTGPAADPAHPPRGGAGSKADRATAFASVLPTA